MAANSAVTRLQKEYKLILREPVPDMLARPHETNILEWHYVLFGAAGSDYEGGVYHGKVVFPPQYPFKPPAITMCTPNGRFAVNTRLCLSMSDFHPETWNPLWSVASILTGLQSFFYGEEPTSGSVSTTSQQRHLLAADSLAHCAASVVFCKLFPDVVPQQRALREERRQQRDAAAASTPGSRPHEVLAQAQSMRMPHVPPPTAQGVPPPSTEHAQTVMAQQPQPQPAASALTSGLCTLAVLGAVAAVMAVPLLYAGASDSRT